MTETLGEELVLSVTESDLDSEEVKDAVLDCEGDGLPDGLPLDDGLPDTCAQKKGRLDTQLDKGEQATNIR